MIANALNFLLYTILGLFTLVVLLRFYLQLAGAPFRIRMDGQARVAPGDRLPIGIDPARASLFDARTEERL